MTGDLWYVEDAYPYADEVTDYFTEALPKAQRLRELSLMLHGPLRAGELEEMKRLVNELGALGEAAVLATEALREEIEGVSNEPPSYPGGA